MRSGDIVINHNQAEQRFETELDGRKALLEYDMRRGQMYFLHTEVPDEFAGRGIGGQLVQAGLEHARAEGLRIVPLCPFVSAYLRKHPEYRDLVAKGHGDGA
jgi:predicted GNAT family acetyltransferase